MTDADKLRVLAAWFDMWDRPETDRQAILDDPRNPGRNEVQNDLLRIAATLDRDRADLMGRIERMAAFAEGRDGTYRDPLSWRLWWRFAFSPFCRLVGLLPIAEWRKEAIITPVDFWGMDHIGLGRRAIT